MKNIIIKICGISTREDAYFCARAGADWLGFIFHPQSPRYISPVKVAEFETFNAKRIGVFGPLDSPHGIMEIMKLARLDMVQLHGGQSLDCCMRIGAEKIIKVFWPQRYQNSDELLNDMDTYQKAASYFLLDAGMKGGGHGQSLSLDYRLMTQCPLPWILAGGLNAEKAGSLNLKQTGSPAGLDFNSAVETSPGVKNHEKVRQAIDAVKMASA